VETVEEKSNPSTLLFTVYFSSNIVKLFMFIESEDLERFHACSQVKPVTRETVQYLFLTQWHLQFHASA
jgi:hypothetical protein